MDTRRTRIKKRFEWLVFFAAISWCAIGGMVYWVDPELIKDFVLPESYLPMMILVALGVFFLLSILFLSSKRAMRWTLATVMFVYLRIWGVGNWMNLVLLIGLMACIEWYLSRSERGDVL